MEPAYNNNVFIVNLKSCTICIAVCIVQDTDLDALSCY